MALDGKTGKELETIKPEDGCKAITFQPITVLLIPQNDDTQFGPKGYECLVLFNG